jgi:hypothetical protein
VASLQHVRWDGKTAEPGIVSMQATKSGFKLDLTQPLGGGVSANILRSAVSLQSWTYRDAPDYGSPELDLRTENPSSLLVSPDRKTLYIELPSREITQVHPRQTARVYHVRLASGTLFDAPPPAELNAYYTLYAFPEK